MKSNIRKHERFRNEYKNDYGHFPSQEELCRELKLSAYSLDRLEKTIFEMKAVSLDAPAAGGESETAFLDYLQSDDNIEEAVTYSVYRKELRAALEAALSILDSSTKQMLRVQLSGNLRASLEYIPHPG